MSVKKTLGRLTSSLQKLDGSLQRGLNNGFAYVMGGKIVASEVEERLKAELDDNKVATYEGYIESPNVFTITLSEEDFANLSQSDPRLASTCAEMLQRLARNNGWVCAGPVVVRVVSDPALKTGQMGSSCVTDPQPSEESGFMGLSASREQVGGGAADVESARQPDDRSNNYPTASPSSPTTTYEAVAAPAARQESVPAAARGGSEAPHAPTVTLLLQDGSSRTYLVVEGSNIIGRGADADFRLPDTGVSRRHAEITWDGQDAVLTDLHSTNGTTVNDIPIDNWLLADGDVITVGHCYIEVRITR